MGPLQVRMPQHTHTETLGKDLPRELTDSSHIRKLADH